MKYPEPYLIEFFEIGKLVEGYISICEINQKIPFSVKRVFWTYYTPSEITRGRHAHYKTEQVLIACAGTITVNVETKVNGAQKFILNKPNKGIYIPPHAWHQMEYTHNAVQLVFASTYFDENDYIRDYNNFLKQYDFSSSR